MILFIDEVKEVAPEHYEPVKLIVSETMTFQEIKLIEKEIKQNGFDVTLDYVESVFHPVDDGISPENYELAMTISVKETQKRGNS